MSTTMDQVSSRLQSQTLTGSVDCAVAAYFNGSCGTNGSEAVDSARVGKAPRVRGSVNVCACVLVV